MQNHFAPLIERRIGVVLEPVAKIKDPQLIAYARNVQMSEDEVIWTGNHGIITYIIIVSIADSGKRTLFLIG